MSDAHLSDHEWRQKMADEGKAVYIPGRPMAEAGQGQAGNERETLTVTLTLEQAQALETAIVDLPELTQHAASALDTLCTAVVTGQLGGDDLYPILSLMARGLKSAEVKEIAAFERFDPSLRKSLSDYRKRPTSGRKKS